MSLNHAEASAERERRLDENERELVVNPNQPNKERSSCREKDRARVTREECAGLEYVKDEIA